MHTIPVGAHEHREAAMAVYQIERYRGLAVLVSSYRKGNIPKIATHLGRSELVREAVFLWAHVHRPRQQVGSYRDRVLLLILLLILL